MKRSKAQKSSKKAIQEIQSDSENEEEVYDLNPIDDGPDEDEEDPVLNSDDEEEEEDAEGILDMPSLADSESGEEEEYTGSEEEEFSDEGSTYEKGVRVYRRVDRPEIEPDYHSDSSDEVHFFHKFN
jgi:hypothetical protein